MSDAKSNYLENKILDYVLRDTADWAPSAVYLSLHTSSPGETDGNEISGNGYSRQAITFAAASGGSSASNSVEEFTASGGAFGTITHFGIHDQSTDGNLLYYGQLTGGGKTIADGDTLRFASGAITISEA